MRYEVHNSTGVLQWTHSDIEVWTSDMGTRPRDKPRPRADVTTASISSSSDWDSKVKPAVKLQLLTQKKQKKMADSTSSSHSDSSSSSSSNNYSSSSLRDLTHSGRTTCAILTFSLTWKWSKAPEQLLNGAASIFVLKSLSFEVTHLKLWINKTRDRHNNLKLKVSQLSWTRLSKQTSYSDSKINCFSDKSHLFLFVLLMYLNQSCG